MSWGNEEDKLMRSMKAKVKPSAAEFEKLVNELKYVNASHAFRDGHFNLLFHASMENNYEVAEQLINKGIDPFWENDSGNTALTLMVKRHQIRMLQACYGSQDREKVKALINKPVQRSGWTLLMSVAEFPASNGHETAAWLLEHGADPTTQMGTGWTAMHAAVKKRNIKVLSAIVENEDCDPYLAGTHRDFGKDSLTPRQLAENTNVDDAIRILKEAEERWERKTKASK